MKRIPLLRRITAAPSQYIPGESVSTPEGEAIVRNVMHDTRRNVHTALVQLIGTDRYCEVPCIDLSPPLEAA